MTSVDAAPPEGGPSLLSIGEVADLSGVPATTIRYYDRIGLVEPVARVGDKRRFDHAVLRRLVAIGLCIDAGFSLDEVRELLADDSPGRVASHELARRKLAEIDEQRRRLDAARVLVERGLRCTCPALDSCVCDA